MSRLHCVLACCLSLVLVFAAGCQAFGLAAYALVPPTVKAEYVPPQTPMLILVENRQNPGLLLPEAESLSSFIEDDLNAFEVVPLVDWRKLQNLRDNDPQLSKRTISEIGRTMGAKQVLYVDLQQAYVGAAEGVPMHGRIDARVRIVDTETGRTTYPTTSESRQVLVETSLSRDFRDADAVAIRQELLRTTGTEIGRLFHKWNRGD